MKKQIFTTVAILFFGKLFSQIPECAWANNSGGGLGAQSSTICTDNLNNVYVLGTYSLSITFGNTTLESDALTSKIYLVKYDPNGNVLWAKNAESNSYQSPMNLTIDQEGNPIIAIINGGDSIAFGNITLYTNNIIGYACIAKLDSDGNALWGKVVGSSLDALTFDNAGGIFITGQFYTDSLTFDGVTIANPEFPSPVIYIAKYDNYGNLLWARSEGATGAEGMYASSMVVDVNGNIIIAGAFGGDSATFGSTTLINNNFTYGSNSIFLAKFNGLGDAIWATNMQGTYFDTAPKIDADVNGYIALTGYFQSDSIIIGLSLIHI